MKRPYKAFIGIELSIDYAHSLKRRDKCESKHGHTAKVIVEIEGKVVKGDTFEGNVVMDFEDLKAVCRSVLDELDHRDLNELFEFPTTENIAKWIFDRLKSKLPLRAVTVYEGEGKWATVRRY